MKQGWARPMQVRPGVRVIALFAVFVLLPAQGLAQLPADRVYVSFARPVEVPGAQLAPGEYLIVLGMPVAGQAVVDVHRARDGVRIASCLVVESRLARPAHATFLEYERTDPPALRAWFHPGNAVGFEFVYPAARAKQLYLASGQPVPFSPFTEPPRDRLGMIAVASTSAPTVSAPQPVGTSGQAPRTGRALEPREHLTSARHALAGELSAANEELRAGLLVLIELIDNVEREYASGHVRKTRQLLDLTVRSLGNIQPAKSSRFSGTARIPEAIETALERVRAHLSAFRSFID